LTYLEREAEKKRVGGTCCPECGGEVVLASNMIYVCSRCGLEQHPLYLPPRHHRGESDSKQRTPSQGHATRFSFNFVDGEGSFIDYKRSSFFYGGRKRTPLPAEKQSLYRRLKFRYSFSTRVKGHSRDYNALNFLLTVSGRLQVTRIVRERAAYLYTKTVRVLDERGEKVNNARILMAACLYLAIQEKNAPVTLREFLRVLEEIGYGLKAKKILKTTPTVKQICGVRTRVKRAEDYLPRLFSTIRNNEHVHALLEARRLELDEYMNRLLRATLDVLKRLNQYQRGGKNPYILATAAIYYAGKQINKNKKGTILTQKLLSKILELPEWTIRENYLKLLKSLRTKKKKEKSKKRSKNPSAAA